MNIAYISADFGVHILGYKGASIHVREMVTAFHRAGHRITIYSPALIDERDEGQQRALAGGLNQVPAYVKFYQRLEAISGRNNGRGVEIVEVPPAGRHLDFLQELKAVEKFLGVKRRTKQELRNLFYNVALYDHVLPRLQAEKIDFIYERYSLFASSGIRMARELGVPHLLEVNAPLAYEQEKMRGLEMKAFAREMERQIFTGTDHVFVVSRELRDFVAGEGAEKNRITILPNAVDPDRFVARAEGARLREQLDLAGKRIIGFVGSLKSWHGTDTLLEAFAEVRQKLPQAHLLIVGDGPERENLQALAARKNLSAAVTFTGKIHYDQIPGYIDLMEVTVAPYIPNENFYFSPIKIFEYMALGKPVIAGNIGQVAEIVRDGANGILYEPGNIDQLAQALHSVLVAPEWGSEMGAAGKQWVLRERTWDNNARQVLEVARRLSSEHEYQRHQLLDHNA